MLQLYNALLNWIKIFSECHETISTDIILSRSRTLEVYRWQKTLEEGGIIIKLLLEKNGSIIYELKFNYDHFNKFVQSLYFLTWQTLSLSELNQNILLPLMLLSFEDLFELRKPENSILYLKSINKKSSSYTSVILFHIGTLLFLHNGLCSSCARTYQIRPFSQSKCKSQDILDNLESKPVNCVLWTF